MVVSASGRLPPFCVLCNAPSAGWVRLRFPRRESLELAALPAIRLDVGICRRHLRMRRAALWAALVLFVAGAIVLPGGWRLFGRINYEDSVGIVGWSALFVAGAGLAYFFARLRPRVHHVRDDCVFVAGVSRRFLEALPVQEFSADEAPSKCLRGHPRAPEGTLAHWVGRACGFFLRFFRLMDNPHRRDG